MKESLDTSLVLGGGGEGEGTRRAGIPREARLRQHQNRRAAVSDVPLHGAGRGFVVARVTVRCYVSPGNSARGGRSIRIERVPRRKHWSSPHCSESSVARLSRSRRMCEGRATLAPKLRRTLANSFRQQFQLEGPAVPGDKQFTALSLEASPRGHLPTCSVTEARA